MTSPTQVDFYFDYLSPYAYLASEQIEALCERAGVRLSWRPVLFAGLLGHWGQLGPAEIAPKALNVFKHTLRYALDHGVPLHSPRLHPFDPLPALRASLAAAENADPAAAIHALFAHGWGRGGDLGDPAEISAALDAAGYDGDALIARTTAPELKARLREQTDAAIARGVFGIPTMVVGDELFWGLDQLTYLERFLGGDDPLAGVDWTQQARQGTGAWRRGVPRWS